MNKVAVVIFSDEKQGYEGARAIRELDREGAITVYADTVIRKDPDGKISVLQVPDDTPIGTLSGLLVGGMVGLLGGPAGLAIGLGAGTLAGAAVDLTRAGVGSDFIDEVSDTLTSGKVALIAEIDEGWQTPLDSRMEALGGQIFRRNRIDVEDAMFAKEVAAYEAELDQLEAELEKASAERKAKIQKRIQDTKQKLQSEREEIKSRMESVKREGDARIDSLQKQIATAREERKERLQERLAETRAEYKKRTAKLQDAWELTKSALTP
jgi:uncharacterized membrane protein